MMLFAVLELSERTRGIQESVNCLVGNRDVPRIVGSFTGDVLLIFAEEVGVEPTRHVIAPQRL